MASTTWERVSCRKRHRQRCWSQYAALVRLPEVDTLYQPAVPKDFSLDPRLSNTPMVSALAPPKVRAIRAAKPEARGCADDQDSFRATFDLRRTLTNLICCLTASFTAKRVSAFGYHTLDNRFDRGQQPTVNGDMQLYNVKLCKIYWARPLKLKDFRYNSSATNSAIQGWASGLGAVHRSIIHQVWGELMCSRKKG